jgi:hypothetical protein
MAAAADKLADVKFPITASWIAILIVVLLTVFYYIATKDGERTLIFFAAITTAAGAVLAAFYSARALATTVTSLGREEERARKMLAFAFTSKWNDPAMFHVRDVVRELFTLDHNSEQFDVAIRDRTTNVIHFLNFLEEVGIAIEKGNADPEILRDAFAGVVGTAWSKLQGWIGEMRRARNRQRIWVNVELLAGKWN